MRVAYRGTTTLAASASNAKMTTERIKAADLFGSFQHAAASNSLTRHTDGPISARMVRSLLTVPLAVERCIIPAYRPAANPTRRPGFGHCVSRAVVTACWNNACIAAVMSPSVVTEKNSPEDAQFCRLGPIWLWYGAT